MPNGISRLSGSFSRMIIASTGSSSCFFVLINREPGFAPSVPTSRNVVHFRKSRLFQNTCRDTRSITAGAVDRSWLLGIQFAKALGQVGQKYVARPGNMSAFPFAVRSNVDDLQSFACVSQFEHAHLINLHEGITSVVPRFHASDEITGEFCEACANEEAHDFVNVI